MCAWGGIECLKSCAGGVCSWPPCRAAYPHTTQSWHNLPVFRNLLKAKQAGRPNEVWVSDLSCLRTQEGYLYMALVTDQYSRKIVGWNVGESLEGVGCVQALERALAQLPAPSKPIHHSDQAASIVAMLP